MKKFLWILVMGCSFSEPVVAGIKDTTITFGIGQNIHATNKRIRFPLLHAAMQAMRSSKEKRSLSPDSVATKDVSVQNLSNAKPIIISIAPKSPSMLGFKRISSHSQTTLSSHPTSDCNLTDLVDHPTPDLGFTNQDDLRPRSYSTESTGSIFYMADVPSSPKISRTRTFSGSSSRSLALSKVANYSFGSNGSNDELQAIIENKRAGQLYDHRTPPTTPKAKSPDGK